MKLLFISIFCVSLAHASRQISIPPIGNHYEIFRFEKSENPQNVLVIYTRLDEHCQFITDQSNPQKPQFDFYWLMNRQNYKVVNFLIRNSIRERLMVSVPADFSERKNFFSVQVSDLREIAPSVQDSLIRVWARPMGSECDLKTSFDLAKDIHEARTIQLQKIYLESKYTYWPPFRKVLSIRVDGVNEKSGRFEQKIFMENH